MTEPSEPSADAEELSATIMRRVAETLRGAGINVVITCERLPELIELYLAGERKAARADGRRAAIEECAAAGRTKSERCTAVSKIHSDPHTINKYMGGAAALREFVAEIRALADQPAPGMPRAGDD